MSTTYHIRYPYSKFWLIFWLIIFFPIGLVLMSRLEFVSGKKVSKLTYHGARFWLNFWALFFFPIIFILFLLNGKIEVEEK